MALSAADRKRLRALGGEIREILGGAMRKDGTPKTFDELEQDSIDVADVIGMAMLEENVRAGEDPAGTCRCPKCDRLSPAKEDAERRVLQTDRGEVSWLEAGLLLPLVSAVFFSLGRQPWGSVWKRRLAFAWNAR